MTIPMLQLIVVLLFGIAGLCNNSNNQLFVDGFRPTVFVQNRQQQLLQRQQQSSTRPIHASKDDIISSVDSNNINDNSRRRILQRISTVATFSGMLIASTSSSVNAAATTTSAAASLSNDDETVLEVIKTASGLKYIDLIPGTGITPQYGNLCSIEYTAYIKLAKTVSNPDPQPIQFDTTNGYLIKHGNGRMIPGFDEGIHTMKVGGYRRLLIPPKLGFVDAGLGPIPEYPWQRYKLNNLLDQMVSIGAGTLIYEIKLLSVIDDEADQGYYSDDSLSPDDFNTLRENLRIKGLQQRAEAAAAAAAATGAGQT